MDDFEALCAKKNINFQASLKTIIACVRCIVCSEILKEPLKGDCGHSACTACWKKYNTVCKICNEVSKYPIKNIELINRVGAVRDLLMAYETFAKSSVLLEVTPVLHNNKIDAIDEECFYEKDLKYRNLKTYIRRKSVSAVCKESERHDNDDTVDYTAKVDDWLSVSENKFIPEPSFTNLTNVDCQPKTLESDEMVMLNTTLPAEEAKDHSSEAKMERVENENSWKSLKKIKKMMKNTRKTKKNKLNVSVEHNTRSKSPVNIDQEIPPTTNDIEIESLITSKSNSSVNDYIVLSDNNALGIESLDKDTLALAQVLKVSQLVEKEPPSNNLEKHGSGVKYFYRGALAKKIPPINKRVPFYLSAPCTNKRSRSASQEDVYVSSIKTPTREANDRLNSNSDLDISDPPKKNKLDEPEFRVNEDMVICFDSQSQISGKIENLVANLKKSVLDKNRIVPNSEDVLNKENTEKVDEKLLALKKSVNIYMGDDEDLNSTIKSRMPTNSTHLKSQCEDSDAKNKSLEVMQQSPSPEKQASEDEIPASAISNASVIEDTPQKKLKKSARLSQVASNKRKQSDKNPKKKAGNEHCDDSFAQLNPKKRCKTPSKMQTHNESDMDFTLIGNPILQDISNCKNKDKSTDKKLKNDNNMDTPVNIHNFTQDIVHQSTPLQPRAKKSLRYGKVGPKLSELSEKDELNNVASTSTLGMNTVASSICQNTHSATMIEEEFIHEALDKTCTDGRKSVDLANANTESEKKSIEKRLPIKSRAKKVCLSCSNLTSEIRAFLKGLASIMGWTFSDDFTPDLTHLVVSVDENGAAFRTVKYIQAVAKGCWIVKLEWAELCMKTQSHVDELPFEVMDSGGQGPYLSRTAKFRMFHKMTFYCLPPIKFIKSHEVEQILTLAGGKVVKDIKDAIIIDPKKISIVLADIDNTEDEKIKEMCARYDIVPVNLHWALDSLCGGNCFDICDWVLVTNDLLPKLNWPKFVFGEDNVNSNSGQGGAEKAAIVDLTI